MKKYFVFLFLALFGMVLNLQSQPLLRTNVETGAVEGVLVEGDLAVYRAIPYAAPPVGDLRWREPQPAAAWEGVRVCDKFGPWPPQPWRRNSPRPEMSEDCLYLGIATPATSTTDRLPVMVWIHGGGFQTEHYGGDLWTSLAHRGVVIVSIEYRTGALGFMAHPELAKESAGGHSGNYGIRSHQPERRFVRPLVRLPSHAHRQCLAERCRGTRTCIPETPEKEVAQATAQDGCHGTLRQ